MQGFGFGGILGVLGIKGFREYWVQNVAATLWV